MLRVHACHFHRKVAALSVRPCQRNALRARGGAGARPAGRGGQKMLQLYPLAIEWHSRQNRQKKTKPTVLHPLVTFAVVVKVLGSGSY